MRPLLQVATAVFVLGGDDDADGRLAERVAAETCADPDSEEALAALLRRPFRPGQLFADVKANGVELTLERRAFLDVVAAASDQVFAANYTHEGFWADHWDYDLDQIESFEAVYPDDIERAMWDADPIPFYMSSGAARERGAVARLAARRESSRDRATEADELARRDRRRSRGRREERCPFDPGHPR